MYNEKQLKDIDLNLKDVINEAMKIYLKNFKEPGLDEFEMVRKDVLEFIKKNKLIVYGGYAQNKLIGIKNKEDQFYNEFSYADVEVYSSNPIGDSMKMGDMLFEKKYKHVQVKEGVHNETYKVFCNFENYADVSYIDEKIFNNMPVIEIEGIRFCHPHFMQVDAYRVYTDLLTSNFRLEKTLTRFNVLMNHYPFDLQKKYKVDISPISEEISSFIKKNIIHNSDYVIIGQHAFNYYAKKLVKDENVVLPEGCFELICKDLREDSKKAIALLKNKFKNVMYKRYYKFFQFFDELIEVYINNKLVLKLYGNNDRCIVYKYSEKKLTKYATFQLLILYLLADFVRCYVNKNKKGEENNMSMITEIYRLRNKFFESNSLTIFDDSPFQEFTTDCIGVPLDQMRESFEQGARKKEQGKRMKFVYNPSGKEVKPPNYIFKNHSGDEIK